MMPLHQHLGQCTNALPMVDNEDNDNNKETTNDDDDVAK
jgi:hypothetical protein